MNAPIFHGTFAVAPKTISLSSTIPVPGFGALAVNAYLIEASEPVLIDSGVPALAEDTVRALGQLVDPADLRWIWLTHADPDHVGALDQLLELAPNARVVTNYLGMGKLSMSRAIAPERFYLINPGQTLDVGDRELLAASMPSFDAPETMGVFDARSGALFSSDCFGALLSDDDAARAVADVAAIDADALATGLVRWATVDAPWLAEVDGARFRASLGGLERLGPDVVLGSHLAPARNALSWLCEQLDASRVAPPFVGPDQAALMAMMSAA
jgi:glyoxylase-like metal-dependent hydrolase (beta-lactamase superfamily II)